MVASAFIIPALACLFLFLKMTSVSAQDGGADPSPAPDWVTPNTTKDFHVGHPADPGAQTWDDLDADEKAAAETIGTYYSSTKHGDAVHQAWAAGTAARSERARLISAQREANLENIEDLGVE